MNQIRSLRGAALLSLLLAAAAPLAWALPWSKDMKSQPSVKAQETVVRQPESAVPINHQQTFAVPADIIELVRARLTAGKTLVNPEKRSQDSIARGKAQYETHCLVCHGDQGRGDGLVGQKFVPDPMNLTLDYVQLQPDGQLFYTISHGSIAMPYYRDVISAEDRWHIINYIRSSFASE